MKKIVIIGAGPSGLVALKELRAVGLEASIFERSSTLGGLFASSNTCPDLHLTLTNWGMAFSDFPDRDRLHYPSAADYLNYLERYVAHFDLERYITFDAEVIHAKREAQQNQAWRIRVKRNHTVHEYVAGALVVATGANRIPKHVPPHLASFHGQIIHSTDYDDDFKARVTDSKLRVLAVGGGESAADISAELASLSPHVTAWLRRPICVGGRYLNAKCEMEQVVSNKTHDMPVNVYLEANTTSRMGAMLSPYMRGVFLRILWQTPILHYTTRCMSIRSVRSSFLLNGQATVITKNQRMCEAVQNGKLQWIVSPDVSVEGYTCSFGFPDGRFEHHEFDVIVLCTGFQVEFPWLDVDNLGNPRDWFLHCFPPWLGDNLFFVGYARPQQGGIPVASEMLSRYIALLLCGLKSLPEHYASKARRDMVNERAYFHLSPDIDTLVDYNAFMESVARRVGCEPSLPISCTVAFNLHMLSVAALALQWCWPFAGTRLLVLGWVTTLYLCFRVENGLLAKWWFYPHWAVWYRRTGPGADASLLLRALELVATRHAPVVTRNMLLLTLWSLPCFYVQRFFSALIFFPITIADSLDLPFPLLRGGLLRPKLFALHSVEWRFSDLWLP